MTYHARRGMQKDIPVLIDLIARSTGIEYSEHFFEAHDYHVIQNKEKVIRGLFFLKPDPPFAEAERLEDAGKGCMLSDLVPTRLVGNVGMVLEPKDSSVWLTFRLYLLALSRAVYYITVKGKRGNLGMYNNRADGLREVHSPYVSRILFSGVVVDRRSGRDMDVVITYTSFARLLTGLVYRLFKGLFRRKRTFIEPTSRYLD